MNRGTVPPQVTPQMYRELFEENATGRIVLDALILRFVRPPVTDGGIDAVLKTYTNLGQRQPLDFIMTQINRANGVQPTEGDSDDEHQ